jgi:hypothetical protein
MGSAPAALHASAKMLLVPNSYGCVEQDTGQLWRRIFRVLWIVYGNLS